MSTSKAAPVIFLKSIIGLFAFVFIQTSILQAQEIRGRILDEKKEPLPSAVIQVYQNGIFKGGGVTDYDGDYMIGRLATGDYDILVIYARFDSLIIKTVKVNESQITTLNSVLELPQWHRHRHSHITTYYSSISGAITGQILDNKKNPLRALLQAFQNNKLIALVETDIDGYYYFNQIEPGFYNLKIKCKKYRETVANAVIVTQDNISTVNINLELGNDTCSTPSIKQYSPSSIQTDHDFNKLINKMVEDIVPMENYQYQQK